MKYIFIHGLGQTSSDWGKTVEMLKKKSNITCPDLFELLSGKEINYSSLYSVFSEYCRAYNEPLILCGLSLGGILALQYTIENPDKVCSMVLIGTQYTMPKKLLRFQNVIYHIMPEHIFKGTRVKKQDIINLSRSMMNLDFREDLHKIKCPTLVLCGAKDKANKRASIDIQKMIPHSKIAFIANAGHEVNRDNPVELGKELNKFFSAISD